MNLVTKRLMRGDPVGRISVSHKSDSDRFIGSRRSMSHDYLPWFASESRSDRGYRHSLSWHGDFFTHFSSSKSIFTRLDSSSQCGDWP